MGKIPLGLVIRLITRHWLFSPSRMTGTLVTRLILCRISRNERAIKTLEAVSDEHTSGSNVFTLSPSLAFFCLPRIATCSNSEQARLADRAVSINVPVGVLVNTTSHTATIIQPLFGIALIAICRCHRFCCLGKRDSLSGQANLRQSIFNIAVNFDGNDGVIFTGIDIIIHDNNPLDKKLIV